MEDLFKMGDTIQKKKNSATMIDRAMEKYSLKLLRGEVSSEETAEYERLSSVRKKQLVKIEPMKRSVHLKGFKTAS